MYGRPAVVDRGSGPGPIALDVRYGTCEEPVGRSSDNLVVCCVHVEDGARIERVAKDIRTLKADITIVITDKSDQAVDLWYRLRCADVPRGNASCHEVVDDCQYHVENASCYLENGGLFCGRPPHVSTVYTEHIFSTPGGGFLYLAHFDFGPAVAGPPHLRAAILHNPESI